LALGSWELIVEIDNANEELINEEFDVLRSQLKTHYQRCLSVCVSVTPGGHRRRSENGIGKADGKEALASNSSLIVARRAPLKFTLMEYFYR